MIACKFRKEIKFFCNIFSLPRPGVNVFHLLAGLAHLEALEMLAVTCTNKLTSLEHSEEQIKQQVDELAEMFSKVHVEDDGLYYYIKT